MNPYLVTTTGAGSIDRCGQELARRLPVPTVEISPCRTSAGWFGVDSVSVGAIRGAVGDRLLLRALRARDGIPHFAHHHFARYGPRLRRPFVVTVHDLIRYNDLTALVPLINAPTRRDRRWIAAEAEGVRRAAAVVAVSQTTRRDLIERLQLDPARVAVVYHGLDHALFRPVTHRLSGAPYVLFVGSEHPRKNLGTLLRAFVLLRRRRPHLRLVKVGLAGGSEARFGAALTRWIQDLGLADVVDAVGEVCDDDLVAWYSGAVCLVLPSRAEGFGLPPLEAMACGCPVVVSTAGALPEIVAGAGPCIEPYDITGWADAIAAVLDDAGLRARMREAGLRRAAEFSWERAAAGTVRVYERLADERVGSSG
jgi:glycosyltransferase involved in cell wall biosynthesis